jgi:hypothetical protein
MEEVHHGAEHACRGTHRELDAALHDDATLLALVAQHVGSSVGAGCVTLMQDREGAIRPLRRYQTQRDVAVAKIGQLVA